MSDWGSVADWVDSWSVSTRILVYSVAAVVLTAVLSVFVALVVSIVLGEMDTMSN